MIKYFTRIVAILLFATLNTYSQGTTTATISGTITDAEKLVLPGATVRAEHLSTGTKYGAKTNSKGKFNIPGMKVGGPYKVTVSMIGFENYVQDDIVLAIDQNFTLNIKMSEKGYTTKEITVIANKNDIINSNKTGAAQTVTEDAINNLPTTERSLTDFARLSPSVTSSQSDGSTGGSSVGGRNNRYNNIQVDGAIMNDAFGLSAAGTPGGNAETQPISIDAIQEMQVSISPFDLRNGGFTGGQINAITRSGTNTYRGSIYTNFKNQALVGNSAYADEESNKYPDFKDILISGRFGGPIEKNELFFFVNGEYKIKTEPQTRSITTDIDNTVNTFYVKPEEVDRVTGLRDYFLTNYDYDIGSDGVYERQLSNIKLFGRLDWNINDFNRMSLRHNFVTAQAGRGVDRYKASYSFENQEYLNTSVQNQTVLQLNSVFGTNIANEFRLAFTSVSDERDLQGNAFPQIQIRNFGVDNTGKLNIGTDYNMQANTLDQKILEFTDNFNWFVDDHAVTVGTSNQYVNFENLFIPNYMGNWSFDNIEDFYNKSPYSFKITYSLDSNNKKPAVDFSFLQIGAYIQDVWTVIPNLKLTYGFRVDAYNFTDTPKENVEFSKEFAGRNTNFLPSPVSLSPRMGFNYDVYDDKEIQIRGGLGVFAGNVPAVWFSNQFANTGVDFSTVELSGNSTFKPRFEPQRWEEIADSLRSIGAYSRKSDLAITDPSFKMPQLMRSNLAVDYHLGYGIVGTLELMYSKTLYDVMYRNINIDYLYNYSDEGNPTIVSSKDGRKIYDRQHYVSDKYYSVIEMANSSLGYQSNISLQIQKQFNQGIFPNLSFNIAYNYMKAKDLNSTTSSVALSNFQYNPALDPNAPELSISNFCVNNRIFANIAYSLNWDEDHRTTVGFYYEGRSGFPFSFVYGSNYDFQNSEIIQDANNDYYRGNDLAYIPNKLSADNNWSDDNMVLVNGSEIEPSTGKTFGQLYEEFIGQFDVERGKVNERNSLRQPWRNNVDLRISHTFKIFEDNKFEISLDIMNFLALLNKEWGKSEYLPYSTYGVVDFAGYEVKDDPSSRIKAQYLTSGKVNKDDIWEINDYYSRWRMQLGIRYSF